MKHIIFTRFMYDDCPMADERLEIMRGTLVSCLKKQTNKNFVWSLMCRDHHKQIISEMYGDEIIFFKDSNEFKKYVTENKFEVQTRHDSDDLMCSQYVQEVQDEYEINKFRKDPFLIDFQPMYYDKEVDQFYRFKIDYKKIGSTSAFITLCPQNTEMTIWDHPHTKWNSHIGTIIRNKNQKCVAATVHNNNTTTGKNLKGELLF